MTLITSSIGTNSRDYSTITAWDADDGGGDGLGNDDCVGECYADSVFTEDISFSFDRQSSLLTSADGEGHDGTASVGVAIVGNFTSANAYDAMSYTDLNVTSLVCRALNVNPLGTFVLRNLVHGAVSTIAVGVEGILSSYFSTNTTIANNIVYDVVNEDGVFNDKLATGITAEGSGGGSSVLNNTVYGIVNEDTGGTIADAVGIEQTGAVKTIKNNIAGGLTAVDSVEAFRLTQTPSDTTTDYNASDDTSATGTNSLNSIVPADQFVSVVEGSEDFHLVFDADCIGAGVDLGTSPTGVNFDIDDDDRDALDVVWDIGADQFIGGAAGWLNKIFGIVPGKVQGVSAANIEKVQGVS